MFNLKEFVVKNIINGIKNGTFSKEYGNIMAVNYLVKGILTEEDVASIDAQISAWETEQIVTTDEVIESTEIEVEETETSTEMVSSSEETSEITSEEVQTSETAE